MPKHTHRPDFPCRWSARARRAADSPARSRAVRIKVEACGICHSDVHHEGWRLARDRVPARAGARSHRHDRRRSARMCRRVGRLASELASAGMHGTVATATRCRRGDYFACQTGVQVTGISFDGGYADYMIAPATALALVPANCRRGGRSARCAPASQHSTRCATAARSRATWSRSLASAASGTWAFSTRQRWVSAPWRLPAVRTRSRSPGNSARLLHRQPVDRPGQRADETRRRESRARHRHARPGDERHGRRPRRRGRLMVLGAAGPIEVSPLALIMARRVDRGLVFRNLDRRARHARFQRPVRRAVDERVLSAGTSGRGVRPNAERSRHGFASCLRWEGKPTLHPVRLRTRAETEKAFSRHARSITSFYQCHRSIVRREVMTLLQ